MPTVIEEKQKVESTSNYDRAIALQQRFRDDPVDFSHLWFGTRFWQKQREIKYAVRDHDKVAVKSANTIGKSFTVADIVMWFLMSFYPSKVIITAPTFTQVEDIVWKEIATLYNKAKQPIGGELLKTELKFNPEWFAMGISTNEVNRFQGFHSPHLLVVIDEALGVDPQIWEAIEGLHPEKILAIGNPLSPEGDFYKCFTGEKIGWHTITISAQECADWQKEHGRVPGLVKQKWIDERKDEWGEKSPLYQARVLGEFPVEGIDTLIPIKYVEQARKQENEEEEDALTIGACDVARSGNNKTVYLKRVGHTIDKVIAKQKTTVTQAAHLVKENYELGCVDSLVVDDDGIGGGVTDILTSQRIGVWAFHGGWKAAAMDSVKFKNLRSQMYTVVAKKFEKGLYSLKKLDQKDYDILKSQLCSIKKLPPDQMGRMRIETKEDMLARGMQSPDYADAFMMAEYGFLMGKMGDMEPYKAWG